MQGPCKFKYISSYKDLGPFAGHFILGTWNLLSVHQEAHTVAGFSMISFSQVLLDLLPLIMFQMNRGFLCLGVIFLCFHKALGMYYMTTMVFYYE